MVTWIPWASVRRLLGTLPLVELFHIQVPSSQKDERTHIFSVPFPAFLILAAKSTWGKKILKLSKTSYMVISINSKHIGKGGFSCCYNWFLLTWKVYAVCKNQVTKIYLKYFPFQIIQNFKNRNLFNSIPLCGSITQNFVCVSAPPKPSKPPMESGNYA